MELPKKGTGLLLLLLLCPLATSWAQQVNPLTLEEALSLAEKQNAGFQASQKRLDAAKALTGTAWTLDRTEIYHTQDQNDIAENGVFNAVWGFRQRFELPSVYATQKNFLTAGQRQEEAQLQLDLRALKKEVSLVFVSAQYWMETEKNYLFLDSLYAVFAQAATRRLETGEATLLEKLTAESKQKEMFLRKSEAQNERANSATQLGSLLGIEGEVPVSSIPVDLGRLAVMDAHPGLAWYEASSRQALYQTRVEQQALLPDLNVNLFRGTNMAAGSKIYPGFEVGVGIPLFFGAQAARIKAGKMVQQQRALEATNFQSRLESQVLVLQNKLLQQREVLRYFETEGLRLSNQLRQQAQRSFAEGEIDFLQYVQLIENSRSLDMQFLQAKRDYLVYQLELIYLLPS